MISQIIVVFLKEMKSILRDKKTFLFGLIVPFLLVPSMLMIIDYSMKILQNQVVRSINISIDNKDNSFYNFCLAQDNINIIDANDTNKAISAYVKVDADIDQKILASEPFNIEVVNANSSMDSVMSISVLNTYIDVFEKEIIPYIKEKNYASDAERLKQIMLKLNVSNDVNEQVKQQVNEQNNSIDLSSLYFNMLVPMMLILYCCNGSSSVAMDMSAGEKERGTLEPLLSTGANRTSIILGKLMATTVIGVLSGMCTTLGLWGYVMISSSNNKIILSSLQMLSLLIIMLFTAMFFAAVNLTIGVYARSYKEAQTYFMPVSIISLLPTCFTYALDIANIKLEYMFIPIFNVVCIIKEIFAGAINYIHLLIVLISLLVYILLACCIMLKMFKKEEIVFRI